MVSFQKSIRTCVKVWSAVYKRAIKIKDDGILFLHDYFMCANRVWADDFYIKHCHVKNQNSFYQIVRFSNKYLFPDVR